MAETEKPPPKCRRILHPSEVVPVPIYSNKVSTSLKLKAPAFTQTEEEDDDVEFGFPKCSQEINSKEDIIIVGISSDSEEETDRNQPEIIQIAPLRSPTPPQSPLQKTSRKVSKQIKEQRRRTPQRVSGRRGRKQSGKCCDDVIVVNDGKCCDDVIVVNDGDDENEDEEIMGLAPTDREISLKIKCRTNLYRIPVLLSTPFRSVVQQLSVLLQVPPHRLLVMREEVELSPDATIGALGLGIIDILECVVMAESEDTPTSDTNDSITVRFQGKDRSMNQEFSLSRDTPLGSVFSQFTRSLPVDAQNKVSFHFDGDKLSSTQTPQQLNMEDGDIIEVWT